MFFVLFQTEYKYFIYKFEYLSTQNTDKQLRNPYLHYSMMLEIFYCAFLVKYLQTAGFFFFLPLVTSTVGHKMTSQSIKVLVGSIGVFLTV